MLRLTNWWLDVLRLAKNAVQSVPESVDRINFCFLLVECNRRLHEFHVELTQFLIDVYIQNNGTWNKIQSSCMYTTYI
jgi:hypothetical protein